MKNYLVKLILALILFIQAFNLYAVQRFPKPEFETKYSQPTMQTPCPRSVYMEYFDVAVLVASLSLITWLILKKRSRQGVFWTTIFSLLYFGFYRKGCICAVGSLQNVTMALFNPDYYIPITAIAFFIIPLVFTMFYGRTFCAGICPLGAIQDIFVLRPMPLKQWVQTILGLIPYIYLGLAVLYAATGTDFIVCRYDPFVGIFRHNGTFMMFAIGGVLLLIGVFVARPYCRFLCPYGVLLNFVSRVSKNHLSIAPGKCIECRLCENSCPFGAINKPTPTRNVEKRNVMVKRFAIYFVITPLLILLGGWTGSRFHENLAKVHPKVRLANELLLANNNKISSLSMEISTFKSMGKPLDKLYAEANIIIDKFYIGGWILGGFLGLVFGLTLVNLSVFQYRTDYTTNKGTCFSCARCVDFCPVKK